MVREIMRDPLFLGRKSEKATIEDISVGKDLLDTLNAHNHECVGMAANMIGVLKCIIAFDFDGVYMVMYNPEIIKASEPYSTEEGCLSLTGKRRTKRFKNIKVRYHNSDFAVRIKTFTGWTAQIIQHEIDHCNGIII